MTALAPPHVVDLPMGPLPTGLRIRGQVLDGSADPIRVVNPATGEVFAEVASASEQDTDRAVRVAAET